ncbi:MAG: hypothetical protein IJ550_07610 [Bacteroidaceae bacterium]|nr:hypothetical protein [Bacteroidaceae bacterium]
MKRYIWQPVAFFAVGLGFYLYNGIVWNTWLTYLPHILGYVAICGALAWALYKKEQYQSNS